MMNNSVNTNGGALLGQKFLRSNAMEMSAVQNRLSSGLRVNSVTDDASTFAVAASMRGDIKSYTAIAASLAGSKITATVAIQAGETMSKRLEDVKAKIVQLADDSLSTASRSTYQVDLNSMILEINRYLTQSGYNGTNLLGSGGSDVRVVADLSGAVLGAITNSTTARDALSVLAIFKGNLDTGLANLGADLKRLEAQVEFIKQTEETVRIGLGALVDADVAKETAAIQSLQVRQQLGVQAMGIANQAPQTLLNLFRG